MADRFPSIGLFNALKKFGFEGKRWSAWLETHFTDASMPTVLKQAFSKWTNKVAIDWLASKAALLESKNCSLCKESWPLMVLLQGEQKEQLLCTSCCRTACIERNCAEFPLLELIKSETPLNEEEVAFLKQCAVLCYLQTEILRGDVCDDTKSFYRLPHALLAELLERFLQNQNTASTLG